MKLLKEYISCLLEGSDLEDFQSVLWDFLMDELPRLGFGHNIVIGQQPERVWYKKISDRYGIFVYIYASDGTDPPNNTINEIYIIVFDRNGAGPASHARAHASFMPQYLMNSDEPFKMISTTIKQMENEWKDRV